MFPHIIVTTALAQVPALDPISLFTVGTHQHTKTAHHLVAESEVNYANLDSPEMEFTAYRHQVDMRPVEHDEWYLTLVDWRQRYVYETDREFYEFTAPRTTAYLGWESGAHQVELSPGSGYFQTGADLLGAQWRGWMASQSFHLAVGIESEALDENQRMNFNFESRACGTSLGLRQWEVSIQCRWDQSIEFSGAYLTFEQMPWQLTASYQTNEWNASDQWRLNGDAEGKTEVNMQQEIWQLSALFRAWQVTYHYQQVDGDMITSVDVLNELVSGVGKGRYWVIGWADFDQYSLAIQPPTWKSRWGNWSSSLDVAYIDNIEIKADVYEPLLFLGLPLLTDTQGEEIQAAGIAVAQISWVKPVKQWQLNAHLSQLVPWYIEQDSAVSESPGGGSGGDDSSGGSGDITVAKKRGFLWPGVSISLGISLRY